MGFAPSFHNFIALQLTHNENSDDDDNDDDDENDDDDDDDHHHHAWRVFVFVSFSVLLSFLHFANSFVELNLRIETVSRAADDERFWLFWTN